MNIQISSIQRKPNKRLQQLNINSPIVAKTKTLNSITPRKSLGYQINFFDIDKAKKYFNKQSFHNVSQSNKNMIHKRTMTPYKTEGNSKSETPHIKQQSMPLSIKIIAVMDNRKKNNDRYKSKSKQTFDIPTSVSKERMNTLLSKTTTKDKEKGKLKLNSNNKRDKELYDAKIKERKSFTTRNKIIIHYHYSNIKHKEVISNNANTKRLLHCQNENQCYASDIPKDLREKMLIPIESSTLTDKNHIKCHKKSNNEEMRYSLNAEVLCNESNKKTNSSFHNNNSKQWNNNSIEPLKKQFIDLRNHKVLQSSYENENNKAKDINYSSPMVLVDEDKYHSTKNRYRNLIINYFSDHNENR